MRNQNKALHLAENKSEQMPGEEVYNFPAEGISVRAYSQEEATEKMLKIKNGQAPQK
jgi:hypothetical protein